MTDHCSGLLLTHLCHRHAARRIDSLRPLLFDADKETIVELSQELLAHTVDDQTN
jgi:hypothetical protein